MINKVLIANRGEIAVRIIRACREMGIGTVAVYSTADRDALHVIMADEAVCIGGPDSRDSYLNIPNILNAAVLKGADAIHPGFGFLAENAGFARICEECNITFVGPSADAIALLGDKARAKQTMLDCGIPVILGSNGVIWDFPECERVAKEMGYPLLIKAAAGGGGRGIRRVNAAKELRNAFDTARLEAKTFFGDEGVYLEKFLEGMRHIEFQILADKHGNIVHLGERDCSLQRRNQKIIEESPSPRMTEELRERMGETAVRAAKTVGYRNAGTVEFLLDSAGNFYFMEMNTRIQVEHPVTEMVTGIDIVEAQIRIAEGKKLWFGQRDVVIRGAAIECRINAENPLRDFAPCGGRVDYLHVPNGFGVRFDSQIYQSYNLPIHYDSMLGKLIVWGRTRKIAVSRMKSALSELIIEGVTTNVDFQSELVSGKQFTSGDYDTSFLSGR
ncbi:MAG: acetyl-CoA carboxylase biotin carboxylase subunit [Clostridiales bacterium]|jgi:acetyl-CoA carboxylase biotin carboxylase subunit|nr:acetyl-CoA carboxylase biotin carboxylase subunit [Clostridiales bacterium]